MLTFIAILVIILVVFTFWAINSVALTPPGHITLVAEWGEKPRKILKPGFKYIGGIGWPFVQKHSIIPLSRIQDNFDVEVICRVIPRAFDEADLVTARASGLKDGIAKCILRNISLNFEPTFLDSEGNFDSEKTEKYFVYKSDDPTQPFKKILEELRDKLQNILITEAKKIDITDILLLEKDFIEGIEKELKADIETAKLPVCEFSIKVNTYFEPIDQEIIDAIDAVSKGEILSNADKVRLARDKRMAEQRVEILRLEAKGKAQHFLELEKALGVHDLPAEQKAAFWQTREALEIQKALATSTNKTFVIGNDLLTSAKQLAEAFTKKG